VVASQIGIWNGAFEWVSEPFKYEFQIEPMGLLFEYKAFKDIQSISLNVLKNPFWCKFKVLL